MRFLLALAVAFTALTGCSPAGDRASVGGQLAPQHHFTLKDVHGNEMTLDALLAANKAVLLNFWATWCPPCREEIPDLIKLQKKYEGQPFTVVGIDVGESSDRVTAFAEKVGINYMLLLDSDSRVAEKYKVVGIPTSLLVSRDGKILGKYHAVTPQMTSDVEKAMADSA